MKITRVQAHPISFRVPAGLAGRDEANHGRAAGAIAKLVDTTLRELVTGMDAQGCVRPLQAPGIAVEVDEAFIAAHPLIDGPCYV